MYFCYGAMKLKKMVKFYVPTWTLFVSPVTYIDDIVQTIHACDHLYRYGGTHYGILVGNNILTMECQLVLIITHTLT